MKYSGLLSFFFLVVLAIAITLACGSPQKVVTNCGSFAGSNTTGGLESVTVCPAVADAQQYPGDQVPFIAIGTYTTQPSPALMPTGVIWGACYQGNPTYEVSVSTKGLAQCAGGSAGTFTVFAFAPSGSTGPCPDIVSACGGGGCQVTGTAQLTCP